MNRGSGGSAPSKIKMQYKIFQIPCIGGEAEDELNVFLRSHRIVSVTKELISSNLPPYWCFCVEYILTGKVGEFSNNNRTDERVDYKEVLSEDEFALYLQLRDLRKAIAERDVVPAFTICTNRQLASMIQDKCTTKASLKQIPGFGEAKISKYGEEFLQILNQSKKGQEE